MHPLHRFVLVLVSNVALVAVATPTLAQDEEEQKLGWFLTTDFSFVLAAGNSESSRLGLGATAEGYWERDRLRFAVGGVRTESALKTRSAVGTSDDFEIIEDEVREKTAENFYGRGRYDHDLTSAFFLFGSTSWRRDTFAGLENRVILAAGAGNTWVASEKSTFRTDYGGTLTIQDDVVSDPSTDDVFGGLRLAYEYKLAVTTTTTFDSNGVVNENLAQTEDLRITSLNSLTVSISELLALKTSLLLLFDNSPSLTEVPLVFTDGTESGEVVFTELEKLDTNFTIALVLNF